MLTECNEDSWRVYDERVLALIKYPFYYTIRRGFGNFFGMIHVLTRHLAPELDRFLFCPGFWSMLCFRRKLDIFGDVLTHGHNWAKMRNKEKRPHAKDGTECNTRFIKEHKPSNHIRARIKSHVYTTE